MKRNTIVKNMIFSIFGESVKIRVSYTPQTPIVSTSKYEQKYNNIVNLRIKIHKVTFFQKEVASERRLCRIDGSIINKAHEVIAVLARLIPKH